MFSAFHIGVLLRELCCVALPALLLCPMLQAKALDPASPPSQGRLAPGAAPIPNLPSVRRPLGTEEIAPAPLANESGRINGISERATPLIVVGFMGGDVRANNLVHREASMAKDLQRHYPHALRAVVFANHDGTAALKAVLHQLDTNEDGHLSAEEKSAARIVIYGHSWGASETVTLARRLNKLGIPVLLTVQVASVEKFKEEDGRIPPNVREAVNFYQLDGLLHGRSVIEAMDPAKTEILGNFESTYKTHPISCAGYPWYARAFMKPHIEIENDPRVWNRIETLIGSKVNAAPSNSISAGSEGRLSQ